MSSVATKPRNAICPDCKGHGAIYLYAEGYDGEHAVQAEYACAPCRGTGWLTRSAARMHGTEAA